MVDRKEIPDSVKAEVFQRAGGLNGVICEKCRLPLMGKAFQYDHQIEEWEQVLPKNLRLPIVAADVKLLGQACCHGPKTAKKTKERAHGKRLVKKAAKITKPKSTMVGSRNSKWKRKMDGTVVRRD